MQFDRLRRREFISLLGGAAAAWPVTAGGQQRSLPIIGFLNGSSADAYAPQVRAFRQGLKQAGYVEGETVAIEYRWADGQYNRLPELANDLVKRQVAVIAAAGTPANVVAKSATATVPVVFTAGSDPVQLGLVTSLSRPGGNITGATQLTGEVAPKRVEVAHELVPDAKLIGLLVNPRNPSAVSLTRASQQAASMLALQLDEVHASTEAELDDAFRTLAAKQVGAVVVVTDAFFNGAVPLLASLSMRHSLPTVYQYHQFIEAGGLISYGGSIADSYRLAGVYVGRILKGERAADLPVQQSTAVELIINLKTAKALGLTVPLPLIGRADELIE
jgi:putative tryptophan/tyrosine transport system substrate-binding protein